MKPSCASRPLVIRRHKKAPSVRVYDGAFATELDLPAMSESLPSRLTTGLMPGNRWWPEPKKCPEELQGRPLDVVARLEHRYVLVQVLLADPTERSQEVP